MLYLTPILPLGPVSYMCGTTSMKLSSFIIAKIAALPLMTLYVFIGASTGALIGTNNNDTTTSDTNEKVENIEDNKTLIISGILLSFVMITFITHSIKKELNKILERQHKDKENNENNINENTNSNNINNQQQQQQQQKKDDTRLDNDDEEKASTTTLITNSNSNVSIEMTNNITATRQRKH